MKFLKTDLVFTALLTLSLFSLTACDGGGGGKPLRKTPGHDYSEYTAASCVYGYTEGPSAGNYGSNVQTSYFGKRINMGYLRNVLGASASEVVRYAETQGVRFYKVSKSNQGSCEMMYSLPYAPSDLASIFASNEDALGLYLPLNTPGVPSTNGMSTIVVRRDANKWVLVHEYMHHLFQSQVNIKAGRTVDIKNNFRKAIREFRAAESKVEYSSATTRPEYLKNAVQKLVRVNDMTLEFVRQFMLEEMAIESIMGEMLEAGELSYVHSPQRINGAVYIVQSSQSAKDFMEMFAKDTTNFLGKYRSEISSAEVSSLRNFSSRIASIESEMNTLSSRAMTFLRMEGLTLNRLNEMAAYDGLALEEEKAAHVGCAHNHEAEAIMNQVTEMLSKP